MKKIDISQASTYIAVLSLVLTLLKLNITEQEVTSAVGAIITFISLGIALYRRHKEGNLRLGVFKREDA